MASPCIRTCHISINWWPLKYTELFVFNLPVFAVLITPSDVILDPIQAGRALLLLKFSSRSVKNVFIHSPPELFINPVYSLTGVGNIFLFSVRFVTPFGASGNVRDFRKVRAERSIFSRWARWCALSAANQPIWSAQPANWWLIAGRSTRKSTGKFTRPCADRSR